MIVIEYMANNRLIISTQLFDRSLSLLKMYCIAQSKYFELVEELEHSTKQ